MRSQSESGVATTTTTENDDDKKKDDDDVDDIEEKSQSESGVTTTTTHTTENDDTKKKKDDDYDDVDALINQIYTLDITTTTEEKNEMDEEDSTNIRKGASWIRESKNIMILSGAGISCSAGIPDFRSPGTGLYDNLQKYNLPSPQHVFELNYYRAKPQVFLSLAKEIWPGLKHSPTMTHSFISDLARRRKLLRSYTQNIDGLEHLAHVPEDLLVECHGHFRTASCIQCRRPMDGERCKHLILQENNTVPTCTNCGGIVKPDIVFFGEGLPDRFFQCMQTDVRQADLLIVMGTSLMVAPVSQIPDYVNCRKILINREVVGNFDTEEDVVLLGDCDTVCLKLASQLGWKEGIETLNRETRIPDNEEEEKRSTTKE